MAIVSHWLIKAANHWTNSNEFFGVNEMCFYRCQQNNSEMLYQITISKWKMNWSLQPKFERHFCHLYFIACRLHFEFHLSIVHLKMSKSQEQFDKHQWQSFCSKLQQNCTKLNQVIRQRSSKTIKMCMNALANPKIHLIIPKNKLNANKSNIKKHFNSAMDLSTRHTERHCWKISSMNNSL